MSSIRPLTTLEECQQVVALEKEIWAYTDAEDVVPAPVLIVTIKRGGILLGSFDEAGAMNGFVYSIPGIKNGQTMQWSHMLGVTAAARSANLGTRLKLAQREATRAMGLDLIEWTYDPLQAMNAHLNFAKLGVVVEEYEENIYGESSSVLHRGSPTDRFVAEWHVNEPHVERRTSAKAGPLMRDASVGFAPIVNPSTPVRRVAGAKRGAHRSRGPSRSCRDPGWIHRDAGASAAAGARVAHGDPSHLPGLLRTPLPRRRLLPV